MSVCSGTEGDLHSMHRRGQPAMSQILPKTMSRPAAVPGPALASTSSVRLLDAQRLPPEGEWICGLKIFDSVPSFKVNHLEYLRQAFESPGSPAEKPSHNRPTEHQPIPSANTARLQDPDLPAPTPQSCPFIPLLTTAIRRLILEKQGSRSGFSLGPDDQWKGTSREGQELAQHYLHQDHDSRQTVYQSSEEPIYSLSCTSFQLTREGAGWLPRARVLVKKGTASAQVPIPLPLTMARETLPFTSSTLRALRLQREWLEWEDRRRAAAQQCRSHRYLSSPQTQLLRPRRSCQDPAVHNALFSGDLQQVQTLFQDEEAANIIVETVSNELAWSAEQGFWVLTPKTKQTAPLTIAAARGYTDCARHLILQGAELDARIGGRAALHEACAQAQPDCVRLLLTFGAKANVLSEEGMTPLHLCTAPESLQCAKTLLEAGATVNVAARESEVTPLHVAAARGLERHVALYLEHGANVGLRTSQGETALNAACAGAEEPGSCRQHEAAARRLLEAGADPQAAGRKSHTPLHNACANGCGALAELLLRHGACAGVANGAGHTPMDCALRAVQDAPNWEPEVLFAALLDYGAQPVHPEMLKYCANFPRALEVLLNAYPYVPSCETWVEAVLPELWQEHEAFYSSALSMENQPRCLQHLARLALRAQLGSRCRQAATQLPLPPRLRDYLLLCVEGRIQ